MTLWTYGRDVKTIRKTINNFILTDTQNDKLCIFFTHKYLKMRAIKRFSMHFLFFSYFIWLCFVCGVSSLSVSVICLYLLKRIFNIWLFSCSNENLAFVSILALVWLLDGHFSDLFSKQTTSFFYSSTIRTQIRNYLYNHQFRARITIIFLNQKQLTIIIVIIVLY